MADTFTLLNQVKTLLSTYLPAQLDVVEASSGVALADPVEYIISKDVDDKAELPHVAIFADPTIEDDWASPLRQLTIPLVIETRFRLAEADRESAYEQGYLYCRAIDNALTNKFDSDTDAYYIDIKSGAVEVGERDNRYKTIATVQADIYAEISRSDP